MTSLIVVIRLDLIFSPHSTSLLTTHPYTSTHICLVSTGAVQSQWLICDSHLCAMYTKCVFCCYVLELVESTLHPEDHNFLSSLKQHSVGGCWYEMNKYLETYWHRCTSALLVV